MKEVLISVDILLIAKSHRINGQIAEQLNSSASKTRFWLDIELFRKIPNATGRRITHIRRKVAAST